MTLTKDQKTLLEAFIKRTDDIAWSADDIHNLIYKISEEHHLPAATAFAAMYQILLDQEKGPRIGYFLSNLDKTFVLKRFQEAIT